MNIDMLTGKTEEHLVLLEGTKFFIHKQMIADFFKLQKNALEAGFNLQIASAFRSYNRQLTIWNAKANGERTILDDHGNPLDFKTLSPTELMFAILRWSALPGSSRHHWGTDIDIYDGNTQTPEEVKLIPSECEGNGPAAGLHAWLDEQMEQENSFGFYRPYRTDLGGVSPERWHLSYYPLSRRFLEFYTSSVFKKNIEESDLKLKDVILENADEIFQRFFLNYDSP